MNHAIETNTRLPQNQLLTGSSGKDLAKVVYRFERQDMTVTLSCRERQKATVEFALGSEMRTFPLSEFIDFLLMMIEAGLKSDSLEFNPQEARRKSRRPKR